MVLSSWCWAANSWCPLAPPLSRLFPNSNIKFLSIALKIEGRLEVAAGEATMDEAEFRRLLDLFPVVRSRNYHPDSESRESTSRLKQDEVTEWQSAWSEEDKQETETTQGLDYEDVFWGKLKLAAERKVGPLEAERFCKAFQSVHKHLVYKELSVVAAKSFI